MFRLLAKVLAALVIAQTALADSTDAASTAQSTAQPNVQVIPAIEMRALDRQRQYRVYLPPGYDTTDKRYPVLYMHDAQNLFDDATAFAGEWGVDEALNRMAHDCGLELIVVGVDHGNDTRVTEYNPYDNERFGKGEGNAYVDFLVNELKPRIDQRYRTLPGRTHTGIMGSSLGGLISNHAINRYPNVFGSAGIFSPSYWIAPQMFAATQENAQLNNTRIYLLAGAREGESMVPDFERMVTLLEQGAEPGQWQAELDEDGEHNEAFWRREFPQAVEWLFEAKCEK